MEIKFRCCQYSRFSGVTVTRIGITLQNSPDPAFSVLSVPHNASYFCCYTNSVVRTATSYRRDGLFFEPGRSDGLPLLHTRDRSAHHPFCTQRPGLALAIQPHLVLRLKMSSYTTTLPLGCCGEPLSRQSIKE